MVLRWLPVTHNKAVDAASAAAAAAEGDSPIKAVLRSKGFMWLSNKHTTAFYWSHAGAQLQFVVDGACACACACARARVRAFGRVVGAARVVDGTRFVVSARFVVGSRQQWLGVVLETLLPCVPLLAHAHRAAL
jgi:hypothetical protein